MFQLHYQKVDKNFAQTKEKLDQYLRDSKQLNTQIKDLQRQQDGIKHDKDQVMEENVSLNAAIAELQRTVQELEAQKDQLEQDKYSTQSTLDLLQVEHEKVKKSLKLLLFMLKRTKKEGPETTGREVK